MKKERRWLKSVIVASQDTQVALPWQRGARRRPAVLRLAAPTKPASIAAR